MHFAYEKGRYFYEKPRAKSIIVENPLRAKLLTGCKSSSMAVIECSKMISKTNWDLYRKALVLARKKTYCFAVNITRECFLDIMKSPFCEVLNWDVWKREEKLMYVIAYNQIEPLIRKTIKMFEKRVAIAILNENTGVVEWAESETIKKELGETLSKQWMSYILRKEGLCLT